MESPSRHNAVGAKGGNSFTRRWVAELIHSGERADDAEFASRLGDLADVVLDAARSESSSLGRVELVGVELAAMRFLTAELTRAIAMIGTELPKLFGRDDRVLGRVAAIQVALITGFNGAMRERIRDEKELIKSTALQARRGAPARRCS